MMYRSLVFWLVLLYLVGCTSDLPEIPSPTEISIPTPSAQQVQIIRAERPAFISSIRANHEAGYPPEMCLDIDLEAVYQPGYVANQFVRHYIYESAEHVQIQTGNQLIPASRILPQSSFTERTISNDVGNITGSVIDLSYCFDVPILPEGLLEASIMLTQMDGSVLQHIWYFQLIKN